MTYLLLPGQTVDEAVPVGDGAATVVAEVAATVFFDYLLGA
jgi:hypothetical protein